MTENQIIAKINDWYDTNNHQAIVDFIENLPIEQRTTQVLSQLGKAYNNLYWQDDTEENKEYLRHAIRVLKYLEPELSEEPKWNYRIGYSYFFLGDGENAKKHFQKERDLGGCDTDESEVPNYLYCIEMAAKKGVSCVDILMGNYQMEMSDVLEHFFDLLEEKAPKLRSIFGKGVSENDLETFEKSVGVRLPNDFKILYQSFSGQTHNQAIMPIGANYFVPLSKIKEEQNRWKNFVETHFGSDWKNIKLDANSVNQLCVKNTLFNEKWLPIAAAENYFICVDLDPVKEEEYGQLITVSFGENLEDWLIWDRFLTLTQFFDFLCYKIKSGAWVYNENFEKFVPKDFKPLDISLYNETEKKKLIDWLSSIYNEKPTIIPSEENQESLLPIDLLVFAPNENRPFYTLATCGIGAFTPFEPAYPNSPQSELIVNVPPSLYDENASYWKDWLLGLADMVLDRSLTMVYGHSVSLDEIQGTPFADIMFIEATILGNEEGENEPMIAELSAEKCVKFFYILPLFPEEALFKLEHHLDDLIEKFSEAEIPYPPVIDPTRENLCQGYQSADNPLALNQIAWAFKGVFYRTKSDFWNDLREYNEKIENPHLEDFYPYSVMFKSPKVKFIYRASLQSEEKLHSNERILNREVFENPADEKGLYSVQILAEIESSNEHFMPLELLAQINNALCNKVLGDQIFFKGIDVEGYEEDGTPVVFLNLES